MRLESVRNLYLVKQMACSIKIGGDIGINKTLCSRIIEVVNAVLLTEVGSKGVLYPYNGMEGEILSLWWEHLSPKDIAQKLGIEEECVLCVIEEKGGDKER